MNVWVNFFAQILTIELEYKSVKWQHINLTNWQVVKIQIIKKLNYLWGRWKEMPMFTWENDSETWKVIDSLRTHVMERINGLKNCALQGSLEKLTEYKKIQETSLGCHHLLHRVGHDWSDLEAAAGSKAHSSMIEKQ